MSEILESPIEFVANHIKTYVATNGEDGHMWQGVPCLLLTTTGRKSGSQRRCALIYGVDGNDYIVVASRGGDDHHPAWFLNLQSNPEVTVSIGGGKAQQKRARIATAEERAEMWPKITQKFRNYGGYQEKTSREIPLILLESP